MPGRPPSSPLTEQRKLMILTIRCLKLEAELDNVKDAFLKLAERVLKLELAVSAHLPVADCRQTLHPVGDGGEKPRKRAVRRNLHARPTLPQEKPHA